MSIVLLFTEETTNSEEAGLAKIASVKNKKNKI